MYPIKLLTIYVLLTYFVILLVPHVNYRVGWAETPCKTLSICVLTVKGWVGCQKKSEKTLSTDGCPTLRPCPPLNQLQLTFVVINLTKPKYSFKHRNLKK